MRFWIILTAIGCLSFSLHKFYVSSTLIEFNEDKKRIEVTMKVFTDDLEHVLQKDCPKKLRLGDKREYEAADSLIKSYMAKHFTIHLNNGNSEWSWIGKEIDIDQTYIYLEIDSIEHVEAVKVMNYVFCEEFPEQINMVDYVHGGKASNLGLTKENPMGYLLGESND